MLDSVTYLTSFGWQGKGNGLRQGSASRPLAIPQKRTLAGLGKDRDEAFPFWDHLFAAAAKSIKIQVSGDEEEGSDSDIDAIPLTRTTTGILSNRRPVVCTPACSGSVTPSELDQRHSTPRLSLMAIAKRDNARKRLYARFFRGPVLGPEAEQVTDMPATALDTASETLVVTDSAQKKRKHGDQTVHDEVEEVEKTKKTKRRGGCTDGVIGSSKKKRKKVTEQVTEAKEELVQVSQPQKDRETLEERQKRKAAKAERRKRKEERRKAKEERRIARSASGQQT